MLVTAGARRYIPDNMDQTPEDIASYNEYKEVIQYFMNLRMQNGSITNGNGKSKNIKVILASTIFILKLINSSANFFKIFKD